MAKFNTECPYCGLRITFWVDGEEVCLDSFKKVNKARDFIPDIQYIQRRSGEPVQLFHLSCYEKNKF